MINDIVQNGGSELSPKERLMSVRIFYGTITPQGGQLFWVLVGFSWTLGVPPKVGNWGARNGKIVRGFFPANQVRFREDTARFWDDSAFFWQPTHSINK